MKPAVLIVDDSLTVRMDLDEAFSTSGFSTTLCATIEAARHALAQTPFSLMVLDVILPDGDGVDFLKEAKAGAAPIPVILLSSEAEVRDRVRGIKTGADDYVGKPYETSYVLARARELIRKHASLNSGAAPTTVLLIDDSVTFREELKAALSHNYEVITAESGEEGLRLAVDCRPGAVIVDGTLPGIDGPTVIRKLRMDSAMRRTPCILLTASEEHHDEVRALEAGADAYMRKDSSIDIILARLAALLRSAGTPAALDTSASSLGPMRILAVDDSATFREELAAALRAEGYDSILATSGEEALELLAAQPADCILLDIQMPGMSGEETCRRIKNSPTWRHIPLIMLSGMSESEAMISLINAGADDFITKSADFDVLKARVRAQLRRKLFEDENRRIREQFLRREIEAAEARAARELADARAVLLADMEVKNKELEAFSYSVSHDLRAPLRTIHGFSQALEDDFGNLLPDEAKKHLQRVRNAALRMAELIEDLLKLSRISRQDLRLQKVDLSEIAESVAADLQSNTPGRAVDFVIAKGLHVYGDASLLRATLENLIGNAWKYTSKQDRARIEVGQAVVDGVPAFFVRDDGCGFDMNHAGKLFGAFQRLHTVQEFPGTGIGLATVHRIIARHGGRVWCEAKVGKGATFYFTLPDSLQTQCAQSTT
jgi:two-component system NtrC family sensor kinase